MLTSLYILLRKNNIFLSDYRLSSTKAVIVEMNKRYAMFVDYTKIHTLAEELSVVAHECGHCMTGSTHKVSSPLDLIERHEYKANKWAIEHIAPLEKLQDAAKEGFTEKWEIAERLGVSEDLIKKAVEYYKEVALRP